MVLFGAANCAYEKNMADCIFGQSDFSISVIQIFYLRGAAFNYLTLSTLRSFSFSSNEIKVVAKLKKKKKFAFMVVLRNEQTL